MYRRKNKNEKKKKIFFLFIVLLLSPLGKNFSRKQGSDMSGKFKFFQGQGFVREFCDVSGKNEILRNC